MKEETSLILGVEHKGSIVILNAQGFIDQTNSDIFEEKLECLLKNMYYKIVVNMAGLNFVGSAGWGVFLALINKARKKGGDMKISHMRGNISNTFKMLGLHDMINTYDTLSDAVDSFRAH